jgi:hypothetical protein
MNYALPVPQLKADNEAVGVLDSRQNGGAGYIIDTAFSKTQGY